MKPIILKVLSGLHKGAELELAPGDWIMGQDAACDLVLSDADMTQEHLVLRVENAEDVYLTPLHGATVVLNALPVPPEGSVLPLHTVFFVGTVALCISHVGEACPDADTLASLAQQDTAKSEEQTDSAQLADDMDAVPKLTKGSTVPDVEGVQKDKISSLLSTQGPLSRWQIRFALLAVFLLLGMLIMGNSDWGLLASSQDEQTSVLKQILHAGGFGSLEVTKSPQGRWLVTGAVPMPTDKTRLTGLLRSQAGKVPSDVQVRVVVVDALAKELRATLEHAGAKLRVDRMGARLRITGYVYDSGQLEDLLAPHKAQLVEIPLKLDAVFWADLAPELHKIATMRQIQDVVTFEPTALHVSVEAKNLSPLKQAALAQLEAEVADLVQGTSPFVRKSARTVTAPFQPVGAKPVVQVPLCQSVQFVPSLSGGTSGLKLQDEIYHEGGRLPGGYRISELTATYVVLVREGNNVLICRKTANRK